jgi:ATP-dependent helicase HrpB
VNTLWVEPISKASADQRAGRAGREGPGTCWRLWTEFEHKGREARTSPEVQRLDLAQTVLWLLSLGVEDVRSFDWLEPPASTAITQAMETLAMLGAWTERQGLSAMGRTMAKIPVHPRWGRMLVEAASRGVLARAAAWAAIASERELVTRNQSQPTGRQSAVNQTDVRSDFQVLEQLLSTL